MIYLCSDTHFRHTNIIQICNRPFENIDIMHKTIIDNWNTTVTREDEVYFLGDFALGRHSIEDDRAILDMLHGTKYLIVGNHDRRFRTIDERKVVKTADLIEYWQEVGFCQVYTQPIVLDDYYILSHAPINGLFKSQIMANIHGHTHAICMANGNYFNVSMEAINYTPISFVSIKESFAI